MVPTATRLRDGRAGGREGSYQRTYEGSGPLRVARLQGGITPRARPARFLPGISRGSSALFLADGEEEAFRTFPPHQEAASGGSTMNAPDRYEKFVVPEGVQKCAAHCCYVCRKRSRGQG